MRSTLHNLPRDPDAALAMKLDHLRGLVDAAVTDPTFRARALAIVGRVNERNPAGEWAAIDDYVRGIRYTPDPVGVELFTDPRLLVQQLDAGRLAAGDCDDSAALAAALAEAVGIRSRFRVGGGGPLGGWRHIWPEALVEGRWVAADTTVRRRDHGWSPAPAYEALAGAPARGYHGRMRGSIDYRSGVPMIRSPLYGGGAALSGFSLKKIVKKISRPIEKAVSRVVPSDIKKVVGTIAKPVQKAWQVTGKLYETQQKLQKQMFKVAQPFLPMAANIIAPGSGVAVDLIQRQFAPKPSPLPMPEPLTWAPSISAAPSYAGQSGAFDATQVRTGGGSSPDSYYNGAEQQPKQLPAWVVPTAVAGAAVVAVLLLSRRSRR